MVRPPSFNVAIWEAVDNVLNTTMDSLHVPDLRGCDISSRHDFAAYIYTICTELTVRKLKSQNMYSVLIFEEANFSFQRA